MKRWLWFVYGVACYLLFLGTFVYMAGFVGNLLVPKSIDSASGGSIGAAAAINLLWIGLFARSIRSWPGRRLSVSGHALCPSRLSAARMC